MMVEYWERVRREYDELDTENGTVEGEWKQYTNAFVGVAEELCGRLSGKKWYTEKQKPIMVDGRGGERCGEKREAWEMIEDIRDIGEQPPPAQCTCMARRRRQPGVR